jgi:hypothetical protein
MTAIVAVWTLSASLIVLVPIAVIYGYSVGHREGVQESESKHAHERVLREQSMRDRTVTSSSAGGTDHARVKLARLRRR